MLVGETRSHMASDHGFSLAGEKTVSSKGPLPLAGSLLSAGAMPEPQEEPGLEQRTSDVVDALLSGNSRCCFLRDGTLGRDTRTLDAANRSDFQKAAGPYGPGK